jgi:hypothetical protein
MRGRVAAVLLLLSTLSFDVFGQCGYVPRYSGQFRATVYDVAVDGSFLWTATGYGVQLLETTPRGPEVADAVAVSGSTRVIAPNGSGLAYAGSGSKIVVLRRNGTNLELVRSIDAPGIVNDLLVTPTHLFAATRSGIAHYELLDPASPRQTNAILTTSRANVTSLALASSTLYAADGDTTVEFFNVSIPSIPQRTGSLESQLRAGAVHVGSDGFLYVSDELGQNSEIFGGTTRIARVPYGSTSFASTPSGALFVAGSDRTLRALDLTNISRPAELFEQQLSPTGGTSNGIFELIRGGNTLYVAAGDLGLMTFDIASLTQPFPMVSYGGGATTSALVIEGSAPKAYFTNAGGTITETSLQLATLRSTTPGPSIVHDSRGSDLLLSADNRVSLSSFTATAFDATFRAAVSEAFMVGDSVMALLADQSVWRVGTSAGSTPQQVDAGGAKISYLARFGSSYALAEVREDGTTVLHLPSAKYTIEGAATGGLALNATHAAFFTFRGLNLVDLATGAVAVLPDSTGVLPRQLLFAGTDLLVLGERTLAVWNTATRTLTRSHPLPANAVRMHAGAQRAVIATDEGMLAINYLARLPEVIAEPDVNRYYTKAVAAHDRLYLFGPDGVDVYSTVIGLAPRFVTAVREPGLIDVAATAEMFFTLAGNGEVTAYSPAGVPVAKTLVELGAGSQPRAIFTAGEAVWVTISAGCQTGICQQWTAVLNPSSLAAAGMMQLGVTDLAVSGTRAYALLEDPLEIAVFDVANPLAPNIIARAAAPTTASSIAFANNRVLVLGDKLYTYSQTLAPAGDRLVASTLPNPQIAVAGSCAVIAGRGDHPELYDAASLTAATTQLEVPSNVRSIATQPGRVYLLTEHSIEVWAVEAAAPAKRRSAR